MADEGHPEEREVTDQIEDFVTDELIVESETGVIHDAVSRQHDGVIECSTFPKSTSLQGLNFLQKPEGSCFGDFALKRVD